MHRRTWLSPTSLCCKLALGAALLVAPAASAQSILFDFEDGTDQGFGAPFSNDASIEFNIVNIGGSNRLEAPLGGFQVAGNEAPAGTPLHDVLSAAFNNPTGFVLSYDFYIDTSLFNSPGTFLQTGTFINAGSGAFDQRDPDIDLSGDQVASGEVFTGTIARTISETYENNGPLSPDFAVDDFLRFGLIVNGNGTGVSVFFDNISIAPIPEPATAMLFALAAPLAFRTRRR